MAGFFVLAADCGVFEEVHGVVGDDENAEQAVGVVAVVVDY